MAEGPAASQNVGIVMGGPQTGCPYAEDNSISTTQLQPQPWYAFSWLKVCGVAWMIIVLLTIVIALLLVLTGDSKGGDDDGYGGGGYSGGYRRGDEDSIP